MDTEDNQSTTKTAEPQKACRLHQRHTIRPLKITNVILKAASAFSAAGFDRPATK